MKTPQEIAHNLRSKVQAAMKAASHLPEYKLEYVDVNITAEPGEPELYKEQGCNGEELMRLLGVLDSTFPNPLAINFGRGRILISKFTDTDTGGSGLIFSDTGKDHPVNSDANQPAHPNAEPKQGEVYLHFFNVESAKAVYETLGEVINEWGKEPTP